MNREPPKAEQPMPLDESANAHEPPGAWEQVKRRFDIECFALTHGITKRQTVELMKKFGDYDKEALIREARWLRP